METDNDYLRTGTAIGFRASRELFSNYLFFIEIPEQETVIRIMKNSMPKTISRIKSSI